MYLPSRIGVTDGNDLSVTELSVDLLSPLGRRRWLDDDLEVTAEVAEETEGLLGWNEMKMESECRF